MNDSAPVRARPTSVTVICWILIVMGASSAVSMLSMVNNPQVKELMARNPIPIPVQYAMSFGGLLVMVVSGAGMLMGQNWARLLYVIWSALGFIVGIITSPMKLLMIPGILVYVVFVLFLFRPAANRFFARTQSPAIHESS
jgi:hypothetical protein